MAAKTVERAMAKAAAALLPGLLPTPPRSTMVAPCVIILPADFPKPGRADSVQRWDAVKNGKKETCSSPASSTHGSSSTSSFSNSESTCRADAVERWDARKNKELCSGSSGRAGSCCERWGMSKKSSPSSSTSSSRRESSSITGRASSCEKWDGGKRPPSRASSAYRWDAHKKHRPTEADVAVSRMEEQEIDKPQQEDETASRMTARPVFSGPSFIASPDPSVLPMPAFFASPKPAMLHEPAFLVAH